MGTIFDGAEITVLVELGDVPFVLDRDYLDDPGAMLIPAEHAIGDLTCDVKHASWTWGAGEWRGPLTIPEAGSCTLVLADPARSMDPARPGAHLPQPGGPLEVLVDGQPAWTGYVADVSHSLASGETVILGHDAIAKLTGMSFPGQLVQQGTKGNYNTILDQVAWLTDRRVTYGAAAGYRAAGGEPQQAWPALLRVARAELGSIWADRHGRVAYRARGVGTGYPATLTVIGCDGADLDDVVSLVARSAIVNHVLVEADDVSPTQEWSIANSITMYGRRSLRGKRDELRLMIAP